MIQTTLKKAVEELGLSPDDPVSLHVEGGKGVIEVSLSASDRDMEIASVCDVSEDYLTYDEIQYYMSLNET